MNLILEPKYKKKIDAIILQYPYAFFAYGSRAKGTAKELSDLDLCIYDDIPFNTLAHIKGCLDNLFLPFSVDLVAWHRLSKDFQQRIHQDLVRYIPDPFLGAQ